MSILLDIRFFIPMPKAPSLIHILTDLFLKKVDMKLLVNDKEVQTSAKLLSELLLEINLPQTGIAVAVNNRIIPRTKWDYYTLESDSKIVIIKAVCGG